MPTVDFNCPFCNRRFTRVVLRGAEAATARCPDCGRDTPQEAPGPKSLFDGIAGFSILAKDTN